MNRRVGAGHPCDDQRVVSRSLYTIPFLSLCASVFLAYANQMMVLPLLPVLVLERGGDATLAGIAVAAFALPSVVVRPAFGYLADRRGRWATLAVGTVLLALSGFMYLVPVLAAVLITRIVHGIGWAALNTGAPAVLAGLSVGSRRGEAIGVYAAMPGLANVIAPALALVLLGSLGLEAALIAGGIAGVAALISTLPIRAAMRAVELPRAGGRLRLLEPSAFLPMVVDGLWTSSNALVFVFPPLVARDRGFALDELPAYYIAAGVALVTGRLAASRVLDRVQRGTAMIGGALLGAVALCVAAIADSMPLLTLSAILYAGGMSLVSPAAMASAMDRASHERVGAAMATYSLGYQVGVGVGALAAGLLVDAIGFPAPHWLALVGPLSIVLVVLRRQTDLGRPGRAARSSERPGLRSV